MNRIIAIGKISIGKYKILNISKNNFPIFSPVLAQFLLRVAGHKKARQLLPGPGENSIQKLHWTGRENLRPRPEIREYNRTFLKTFSG